MCTYSYPNKATHDSVGEERHMHPSTPQQVCMYIESLKYTYVITELTFQAYTETNGSSPVHGQWKHIVGQYLLVLKVCCCQTDRHTHVHDYSDPSNLYTRPLTHLPPVSSSVSLWLESEPSLVLPSSSDSLLKISDALRGSFLSGCFSASALRILSRGSGIQSTVLRGLLYYEGWG